MAGMAARLGAFPNRMHSGHDIVVVGASAGGVEALRTLVGRLPADFSGSIFIVLHSWPDGKSYLVPILERASALAVRQPDHDEEIRPGTVYVAPTDLHMMIERDRIHVVRGPRENHARPAINPL